MIRDHAPRARHDDGVEIARVQVGSEKAVDRLDVDRLPRQHGDAMFGHDRLQYPRGHAIAAARWLHRRLNQQHTLFMILRRFCAFCGPGVFRGFCGLHRASTCAVASASIDRTAVTPYRMITVRRTDHPRPSSRWWM